MSTWKDRKRGDWRYKFQYRLRTYAGGGFKTRREAAAGEAKRREEIKKIRPKSTGMDFLEVSNAYLDDVERRYVHSTYSCKRLVFATFLDRVGNVDMASITPQRINAHLQSLPSNCRFNVHRKELSSLWQWGIKVMQINMPNPINAIDRMPHTAREKVIPAEEEIIKLILAAHPGDEKDLILVILHTLARIDEVLRLKWSDVNFDKRVITLWTRKRRGGQYEADTLPMSQDLTDLLMRRWKARKQDQWVFWNEIYRDRFMHKQKTMKELCKRAGVQHYGFHALRHFMASYHHDTLKTGTSAVSKLLRHKSRRTTELYLHSIDESVRSAINRQDGMFKEREDERRMDDQKDII